MLAVRDIMGINLSTHQRIDIRVLYKVGLTEYIRLFGRGLSKTFDIAIFSLLNFFLVPSLKILLLGGEGFRQGKFILEECERIINCNIKGQKESHFLRGMIDNTGRRTGSVIRKDPDMWRIVGKNGSVIATAPLGSEGEAIRGFRSNINAVDERKSMKKEIYDKVIKPFSIVGYDVTGTEEEFENKNINSGTLESEEDDYTKLYREYLRHIKDFMDGKTSECRYAVTKFVYADAYKAVSDTSDDYDVYSKFFSQKLKHWNTRYNILVRDIETELDNTTADFESWLAEHMCIPIRGTGDYYSYRLIKNICHKVVITDEEYVSMASGDEAVDAMQSLSVQYTCDDPVIIGIDVARESDLTAFVVIRVGPMAKGKWDPVKQVGQTRFSNVIWAHQEEHMHDPDIATYTYSLLERYPNTITVKMDKRGGGSGARDQFYHVVKNNIVDSSFEILFDPTDDEEGGIVTLMKKEDISSGNNRLGLVMYSDKDNTLANRAVRGMMKQQLLFFPNYEEGLNYTFSEDEEREAYRNIALMGQQFRWIKTKPTANWLNFHTKDPKKQKKDLYSACLYAADEVYKLTEKGMIKRKRKIVNSAPFVTVNRRI